jgi:hypothetical protein
MSDEHPLQIRITALGARWMDLIGADHHKDRDCHFGIEKVWSYGMPPVYRVWHDGYVAEIIDREFSTSHAAHRFLADEMEKMIRAEEKITTVERNG